MKRRHVPLSKRKSEKDTHSPERSDEVGVVTGRAQQEFKRENMSKGNDDKDRSPGAGERVALRTGRRAPPKEGRNRGTHPMPRENSNGSPLRPSQDDASKRTRRRGKGKKESYLCGEWTGRKGQSDTKSRRRTRNRAEHRERGDSEAMERKSSGHRSRAAVKRGGTAAETETPGGK